MNIRCSTTVSCNILRNLERSIVRGVRDLAKGFSAAVFAVRSLADVTKIASRGAAISCAEDVSNVKKDPYSHRPNSPLFGQG